MTTRTDPLPLIVVPSGGFAWRRLFFSFAVTLLAVVLFATAFALGYLRLHQERMLPGVFVAGVSVAGLDRVEAEALLRERLPSLSSGHLTVRFAGEQAQINYWEFGRDYNMPLMLDQALSVGRDAGVVEQIQEQLRILLRSVSIESSYTLNHEELARRVAAIATAAQIEPVDARIVRTNGTFTVVPASAGQAVDVAHGVELAMHAVANLSAADTSIAIEGVVVPPQVSTEVARAAVERIERVAAAPLSVTGGGASAAIGTEQILGWTRLEEGAAGEWAVIIERAPIVQYVVAMALDVDTPARNASFTFRGDDVVAVAGREGQAVDVEASAAAIYAALEARITGGGPPSVNLAILPVAPDFTYEQAQALAPRVERLSSWRTNFVSGPMNYYGANIAIPTTKIHGTVLAPGEVFDYWDVVGYPSEDEGYGPGGAIIRGRTVPDGALAGGICSSSTTIFNAALRAGLKMGARRNHYYYISRYPVGLDATVWISGGGARQTMRFTNDMDYPILIRGINRPGAVIFEIWGVDDGRTVSFSEPRLENQKRAFEVLRYSNNLNPGQRRRVEWPANGFDSYVTRTVNAANGRVIHEDTYYSRYAMIKGVTLVGRSPGDPKHGTEVRAGGGG